MQAENSERPPRSGGSIDSLDVRLQHEYESFGMPSREDDTSTTDSARLQSNDSSNDYDGDLRTQDKSATLEIPCETEQEEVGLHSREAAEVAAAARFISQIDNVTSNTNADATPHAGFAQKPRLGSSTNVRDSILESPLISKAKVVKSYAHAATKRSKTSRPPPLQLDAVVSQSGKVQTPLPERSSSRGAPSFHLLRSTDTVLLLQEQPLSPKQDMGFKSPPPVLTPESATTFQFDFDISKEPRLSRSESAASTVSQSPPTPATGPSDDQVRREIEAFALEQGPHLRGGQRRAKRLPILDTSERGNELDVLSQPSTIGEAVWTQDTEPVQTMNARQGTNDTVQPVLQRKRSIFGWLQKKPEVDVDDLIDLYLTEEQLEEVKTIRSKSSKPRLPMFRSRTATDPLPLRTG